MTTLAPIPKFHFDDSNGAPLAGGKLYCYIAGTTTKQNTFTDSTGGSANTNPVILDSRGEANVWLTAGQTYKFVLSPSTDTDPPTNAIWTVDQVPAFGTGAFTSTFVGGTLTATTTMSGVAFNETFAQIASATTTDIGAAAGNYISITGTTTITSLGNAQVGSERTVRFNGALTLTYDAVNLILPGAASITTASGDTAIFRSDGANAWRCIAYTRASGLPVFTKSFQSANQTITLAGGLTLAHGLAATPKIYLAFLVNVTGEGGYSAGQEINWAMNSGSDGVTNRSLTVVPDGTNLNVRFPSGNIAIGNFTTGVIFTITPANWALVMRAWA